MSFTGDLEDLPIVDVIQLLHSTRKSGVLQVNGRKGESRLVFKDGFIVSASHLNNSVRIGDLLLGRKAITREDLDRAIREQNRAGAKRKPLIVTLLEKDLIKKADAYAGLQSLIELTIVEILTWKTGNFSLALGGEDSTDDYQFCPENILKEITIDTQGVLMDALRIFDEKRRDGELPEEDEGPEESVSGDDGDITAEDLGLSDLDLLENKVPAVFKGLDDPPDASLPDKETSGGLIRRLNEVIGALPEAANPPEVALAVLRYVSRIFERSSTLVVRGEEVIVERGIGVRAPRDRGESPPPGIRIPLAESPLLRQAVSSGTLSLGEVSDPGLQKHYFSRVGAPAGRTLLLLPVKSSGKTVFLTMADFGPGSEKPVQAEMLEMLAGQASMALENLLLRRKMAKTST
jgi:hypothetical protein